MSTMAQVTDTHGNCYAPVDIEELDEWAWLLGRLEDWLAHACDETVEDWNDFTGPCSARIDDVVYVLDHWTVRMANRAEGQP